MPRLDPLAEPLPLFERVYAYVAYRIGSGPEAEDVTSEAFARAARYRHRYNPARGDPTAWLIGIASRCINDALSARRHDPAVLVERPDFGDFEERTVEKLALAAAIRRLPARDRELVALRYGAGLDPAEIAAHLQIRRNAVDVALHRALGRLRGLLDPQDISRKKTADPEVLALETEVQEEAT